MLIAYIKVKRLKNSQMIDERNWEYIVIKALYYKWSVDLDCLKIYIGNPGKPLKSYKKYKIIQYRR